MKTLNTAMACVALVLAGAGTLSADTIVRSFDDSFVANGQWFKSDIRQDGTASTVDLTGAGGDLENNQPLPIGAALLTTGFDDGDKAEVAVANEFGTISSILDNIELAYSYHKANVPGGNAFAAPSLKLAVFGSHPDDGFVTLIYEPTWNQPGNEGSSTAVPTDQWTDVSIDADTGLFWQTGGFGQSNSFGGPPLKTLSDWSTTFDSQFLDAELVAISMGVGTFNQGQEGYFDDVQIAGTDADAKYNFEPIPTPTAALAGLGLLGGMALRRRRLVA